MQKAITLGGILRERLNLDEPRTHMALGMVPLLSEADFSQPMPRVLLVEEALEAGFFYITETSNAGQVPFLQVENKGETAVLILDGEELIGGKQNRIVNTSILILPGKKITIPVSCMEAGRWYSRRWDFDAGRAVFRARSRATQKVSVTESLRGERTFFSDQYAVWREVDESLKEVGAESQTRDFRSARARVDQLMESYLSTLRPLEAQLGAVFYGPQGVLGCEILGSTELFRKSFAKILKSFAFEVVFAEQKVRRRKASIANWWDSVLGAPLEMFKSPGDGQDVRLAGRHLIGSGLVWEGRLMHFSCFPKELSRRGHDPYRMDRGLQAGDRRGSLNRRTRSE